MPAPPRPARSRYLPARVLERVLERAEYRCEFQGPDGTRCTSRTGLEIEHVKPFAIFRDHDERFLEALCPGHNRYRAERVYGEGFICRKIEERSARGDAAGYGSSGAPRIGVRKLTPRLLAAFPERTVLTYVPGCTRLRVRPRGEAAPIPV